MDRIMSFFLSVPFFTVVAAALAVASSSKSSRTTSLSNGKSGSTKQLHMPFRWGVATAAYQIEGATAEDGRGSTIWDIFSGEPGKIHNGDTGTLADDSYHKVVEDIQLIKNMGLKSYRFSIAWSRIMPTGQLPVNEQGIAHYNFLLDELVKAGIEPLVTLYHWDLPQGLHDQYGGWLSPQIEEDFARYADVCFTAFGDRVKLWTTMNEPWTVSFLGYVTGAFAPGRCSNRLQCTEGNSSTEGYIAAHNILNSHAAAVELYREKYQPTQKGLMGMTLNQDWGEPLDPDNPADVAAAQRKNEFQMGWFADPMVFGDYPDSMKQYVGDRLPVFSPAQQMRIKGSIDFFAFNHYTTKYFSPAEEVGEGASEVAASGPPTNLTSGIAPDDKKWGGWADDMRVKEHAYDNAGKIVGLPAASKWLHVVPWGFYNVLMWNYRRYQPKIILITENGCDVPGEDEMTMNEILDDQFRIDYYRQYLAAMDRAISEGVPVRGYYAWSLMDNFEWADGYAFRFGLHYVDFKIASLPRYPKASASWFANYAARHPYDAPVVAPREEADDGVGFTYAAVDTDADADPADALADGDGTAGPLEGAPAEDEVDRQPLLRSLAVFGLLAVICALVIDAFVTRSFSMLVTGRYHSAYGSINDTADVELPSAQP